MATSSSPWSPPTAQLEGPPATFSLLTRIDPVDVQSTALRFLRLRTFGWYFLGATALLVMFRTSSFAPVALSAGRWLLIIGLIGFAWYKRREMARLYSGEVQLGFEDRAIVVEVQNRRELWTKRSLLWYENARVIAVRRGGRGLLVLRKSTLSEDDVDRVRAALRGQVRKGGGLRTLLLFVVLVLIVLWAIFQTILRAQ